MIYGRINKSVALEEDVWKLVKQNRIENFSRYINELIRKNLSVDPPSVAKGVVARQIAELQEYARNNGISLEVSAIKEIK